jgi:hypothetical protein
MTGIFGAHHRRAFDVTLRDAETLEAGLFEISSPKARASVLSHLAKAYQHLADNHDRAYGPVALEYGRGTTQAQAYRDRADLARWAAWSEQPHGFMPAGLSDENVTDAEFQGWSALSRTTDRSEREEIILAIRWHAHKRVGSFADLLLGEIAGSERAVAAKRVAA